MSILCAYPSITMFSIYIAMTFVYVLSNAIPIEITFDPDFEMYDDTTRIQFTIHTEHEHIFDISLYKHSNPLNDTELPVMNCVYRGVDDNYKHYDILISLCSIRTLSGHLSIDNGLVNITIEPCIIDCGNLYNATITGIMKHGISTRDVTNMHRQLAAARNNRFLSDQLHRITTETLYLRVLVATDKYYESAAVDAGLNVIKSVSTIMNMAAVIFRQLNIVLYIGNHVSLSIDHNIHNNSLAFLIDINENAHTMLNKRYTYDAMNLLSHRGDKSSYSKWGVNGYAYIDRVCYSHNIGYIFCRLDDMLSTVETVAHEIGHILGINHDDATCVCDKYAMKNGIHVLVETNYCIQHSHVLRDNIRSSFSNCSMVEFYKRREWYPYMCMTTPPVENHVSSCGNGLLETGETCDCGYKSYLLEEACLGYCNIDTCQVKYHKDVSNTPNIPQCALFKNSYTDV